MYTGPKVTNENLVFGYDTGYGIADNGVETRFYKGEPTSNILPSPERNGRFTTANSWGSYNTNQYNGNTYFSIGTVSGVSNNIVTLSSVGRNIRSFDVLRAQTTGGGVTAGTNYVIKKISSTTFSLHAYNSSQNGSQGYINPSTGFFKVHDAYANDTRVSINATSFPTMWWGAPHLPNSGLIKEIVPNGGYIKGTDCLRLHIYRGDGVRDGMAYNVYCPVTQGDVITVSYWVRPVNSLAHGKTWNYQTYFGGGNSSSSFNTTLNSTGEWQHVVHQWTASVTYNFYSYWFPSGSTDKWAMDMADLQVEVNKGHATPFTLTSRSDTASLIDLTKTANIDVSGISFDSNAQPVWDGTDDRSDVTSHSAIEIVDNVSIEYVYKRLSTDPVLDVIANKYHGTGWELFCTTSNKFALAGRNGDGTYYSMSNGAYTIQNNQYYHLVAMKEGLSWRLYVNGELYASLTANSVGTWSNTGVLQIGGEGNGYFPHMELPVLKVYNRVLSTAEIKQNYKAYKNRFI
tara:strand:- start:63 stop:1607 length:1545 start_codon:yes stop_codon:yes gene_type:complete